MNVTELSRKLKLPTKDLLEMLPEMGFDIGRKAIKINNNVAHKIIKDWKFLYAKYLRNQEAKKEKVEVIKMATKKKKVVIPDFISVKDFSIISGIPITTLMTELMKSGTLTSMNEKIDFDTASIIGEELGVEVERKNDEINEEKYVENSKKEITAGSVSRPPVVVIMGHVDHGKTLLLDTIRTANVIGSESGGITQHIGAYQIDRDKGKITFIDTPGHEAFTTMRSRGAKIADIAILVVAADDGIKPQTKESIKIIKSGKLKMIVAINKIDKPDANIEKVKQELASENLLPEDWGGDTITVPISAKTGDGIDELLETILLVAEIEKENIVADPSIKVQASIIESHIDKGEGPVATALIQQGTLRIGDLIFFDGFHFGKIKALKDHNGKKVTEAGPSMPVKILGFKGLPSVGDVLTVEDKADKKSKVSSYRLKTQAASVYSQRSKKDGREDNESVNLILRADVLGSLEAIISSIEKISHKEVNVNIIGKGLGHVTENDIMLSESNKAHVMAFHTTPTQAATNLALEKNIEVQSFKIIYELIDKIKQYIEEKLKPEITITQLGKVEILKVFKKLQKGMVVGGKVTQGSAFLHAKVKLTREGIELGLGNISLLQSNKIEVKDVSQGNECGIQVEGITNIQEGDILEIYNEEIKAKKLG